MNISSEMPRGESSGGEGHPQKRKVADFRGKTTSICEKMVENLTSVVAKRGMIHYNAPVMPKKA
jgi:hypothetical protein